MNYVELSQAIQDYSENTETSFVANIPMFIKEAEKRIYNSVQLPSLRRNVTGSLTVSNKYMSLPDDWLSTYSLAVIDQTGRYTYLLNKDVNYLREAYPNPTDTGLPKYYAIFGPQSSDQKELSAILAPMPDYGYSVELHYYYYPTTIVQGEITATTLSSGGVTYISGTYFNVPLTGGSGQNATATITVTAGVVTSITITNPGSLYVIGDTLSASNTYLGGTGSGLSISVTGVGNNTGRSWLGDNYDPVLFYGAMREAVIYMKGEQDMVTYYQKMYEESLDQLKRLGDGLERGDAYRDGQTKIKVVS
jgi:hypothetical protein